MIKDILMYLVVAILCLGFLFVCFKVARSIHYNFSYKNKVQAQVCEMVKSESLVKPCD